MNTQNQFGTLSGLTQAWTTLQSQVPLRPIRTEVDFAGVRALADTLADAVGDDDTHPLFSLFELTMELIERWEDEHVSIPAVEPREVLRHLLEANNLKQKDLEDIASTGLVSDILAGRREISKRLAKCLAERFRVDVSVFI
ncbi:helix-turn-helix domain-containing protein [Massilia glaciei]|uniref:Transcriptional regulator n=1 Tax=Massilia glaciei TaxID=1524097 RepID=A0A2U2I6H8_9BURK|nr:transcriptional regulator [Massilia glaciei]PWF55354.1 transcriptional regulator [Massilia glaciei]